MTVTVSCAAGGVHFAVVATLAVAVSVTELTEVAPEATGIWAFRLTALESDTEPIVQFGLPVGVQLLNAGFWLDGAAVRATEMSAAEPFWVETATTNVAFCPRFTLACVRCTLTQSSGCAAVELALWSAEM